MLILTLNKFLPTCKNSGDATWICILLLVLGCYCSIKGSTSAHAQNGCVSPDVVHTLGEEQILHEIVTTRVLDQKVFVLTQSDPVLHVLDLESDSYAAWGTKGEGPGEVQNPRDLAVDENAVYILDMQLGANRIRTYTHDGAPQEELRVDASGLATRLERAGDDLIVVVSPFQESQQTVLRISGDTQTVTNEIDEKQPTVRVDGGEVMQHMDVPVPFQSRTTWTITHDGYRAVWTPGANDIVVERLDGTSERRIPLTEQAPIPVTDEDQEAWAHRTFPEGATLFGRENPYREVRPRALETVPFPETFAPVLTIKGDPGGGLWIHRADTHDGQRWTYEHVNGERAAMHCFPAHGNLTDIGETFFVVVNTPPGDVETVTLHRKE